jgi:hypothetical protein
MILDTQKDTGFVEDAHSYIPDEVITLVDFSVVVLRCQQCFQENVQEPVHGQP